MLLAITYGTSCGEIFYRIYKMKSNLIVAVLATLFVACNAGTKEADIITDTNEGTIASVVVEPEEEFLENSELLEHIAIIDFAKDSRAIIVTEITPTTITVGPIDESTGEFYEVYQQIEGKGMLNKLTDILYESYYTSSERIGEPCGDNNFYISLTMKKEGKESKVVTFVNHYEKVLEKGISQLNKELSDSLQINYGKEVIKNCK
jgi:hypothetical protein